MNNRRINIASGILLVVGLAQMTGDLLGIAALKGLGAATMISPAPKVFTAHKGHETYSATYVLEWTDKSGAAGTLAITPETMQDVLAFVAQREQTLTIFAAASPSSSACSKPTN
ncbi:MAG: hypothetical protein HC807_06615 [Gammaproteobacteria bacterium]|nr:hypothetical protein [Gammaproteobacteria bacterium]